MSDGVENGRVVRLSRVDALVDEMHERAAAALNDAPQLAERATQIESGRGAIPAQIGDGPTQLLETLRAAHRRFG